MDIEYYQVRAAAERAMASATTRKNVAAIHEELALLYESLVEKAECLPPLAVMASHPVRLLA